MAISSTERRTKNVQVFVEKDAVETSFEKWAQPGHFSRTLAKGPKTTTWIWNLHADAHDFDSQTSSLEEVSRKIFSAHFGQLAAIFLWISGMHFHGAYFSNYSAWLNDPINIKQSSQVVWPIVGQEILNADVGGNFQGVQTTSGWFQMWRAEGITSEVELYWIAIGGLAMSAIMLFAGWFHYHKAAPKLEWFQNAESMMNHHLAGLLGLGGGIIFVPLLYSFLGLPFIIVVATSMFVIFLNSIIVVASRIIFQIINSGLGYSILLDYGLPLSIASTIGAYFGSSLTKKIGQNYLSIMFWSIAIFASFRMMI